MSTGECVSRMAPNGPEWPMCFSNALKLILPFWSNGVTSAGKTPLSFIAHSPEFYLDKKGIYAVQ